MFLSLDSVHVLEGALVEDVRVHTPAYTERSAQAFQVHQLPKCGHRLLILVLCLIKPVQDFTVILNVST